MCRLFGFRSVIPSQVHSSLVEAENALGTQSNNHPDGWGVAYYVDQCPQVTRSPLHALGDQLFHRLSGVAASETVLAHVRKATQGEKTVLNCHPFQYGRWVFAHNGDIPNFAKYKAQLSELITPRLRRYLLGDTDSETVFYILLSELEILGPLNRPFLVTDIVRAWQRTEKQVRQICEQPGEEPCLLTVIVTDGHSMLACHGGKELFWSTYKTQCSERDRCPSFAAECEGPSDTGFVNHFLVSSEPLSGENVWLELKAGDIVAVDGRMRTLQTSIGKTALDVLAAS